MIFKNSILKIILIMAIISGAACAQSEDKGNEKTEKQRTEKEKSAKGPIAEDFTLERITESGKVTLSDYRGKPVFLDFWASWCPPCRTSTPYVKKLENDFGGEIHVIGINMDRDMNEAINYIKENELQYPNLKGDPKIAEDYSVTGIPSFFIIDSEGKIVQSFQGYRPGYYDDWKGKIKKLIE
ncbi:MAG: TlpA family protein disulfide reductase [Elusimicrobiota bacterium]